MRIPLHRRAAWVALGLIGAGLGDALQARQGDRPRLDDLLARAAAKVEAYLAELPRLVATEAMTQQVVGSSSEVRGGTRREWVADLAWVRLADEHEAIAVRDVLEVDGQPVMDGRSRLIELLHGPDRGTWSQARALLDQGARHNLVAGSRNFNLPTVTLFFLHPERRPRFRWHARWPRAAPTSSPEPFEIQFRERSRPTVIRGAGGEQIYGRGRVRVTAEGTIVGTELQVEIGPVKYTLATEFRHDAGVALVVPYRMTERYEAPDGIVVSTARYFDYRRYHTGARLVVP